MFSILKSGSSFDKKKFSADFKLFQNIQKTDYAKTTQELDFFNQEKLDFPTVPEVSVKLPEKLDQTCAIKNCKISTLGNDIPPPIQDFSTLPSFLVKNIPFKSPTPIQKQAIPILAEKRDVIACAETGSGKTLAYLIPILIQLNNIKKHDGIHSIIIAPTRELALQIQRHFNVLAANTKYKCCLLSKATNIENPSSVIQLSKTNLLISTPMRLVHAIQNDSLKLASVRHLVLDEADKLLELGFLEQIDVILSACSPTLQQSLFSATMPASIERLSYSILKNPIRIVIGIANTATKNIKQELVYVGKEEGKLIEIRQRILSGNMKPPVLVFVQSADRAKELYEELLYEGIRVDMIHADRTKAQRDAAVNSFRIGDSWVLISTDLMARGIDFKGVETVVNYDFPQSVQSYIHRIGRTGRAGRQGHAVTLFTKDDSDYLKIVVNVMKESGCEVADWMLQLKNPTQNEKNQLRKRALEREAISTAPKKASQKKRKHITRKVNPVGGGVANMN